MTSFSSSRSEPLLLWRLGGFALSLLLGLGAGLLLLLLLTALPSSWMLRVLPYGEKTAWYVSRSTGTVAYFLLSASTIWGLILSSKIVKEAVPAPLSLAMHSTLSWLAVALSAVHAFVLLFDGYYAYAPLDLLLPFGGPYRPAWVGLGIVGFYLAFFTSASFSARRWLGQRVWRALHGLTFVAFVLATAHGLTAGTDSGEPGMRLIYAGAGLLVLFLTNYRLLARTR